MKTELLFDSLFPSAPFSLKRIRVLRFVALIVSHQKEESGLKIVALTIV